jgi:hypothetical protein
MDLFYLLIRKDVCEIILKRTVVGYLHALLLHDFLVTLRNTTKDLNKDDQRAVQCLNCWQSNAVFVELVTNPRIQHSNY